MRANMIKVPCLLLAFFRRYLRGYQGKNKFGLASSKLSVSRDKRKKMWTHKKTHEHCEDEICFPLAPILPLFLSVRARFSFRLSPLNERPDLATD